MLVDFEILIVLNIGIIFTIVTVLSKDPKPRMVFSALSFLCWITLAFAFMGATPTFPMFSLLFLAIALILALSTLLDAVDMLRLRQKKRYSLELD